MKKLVVLPHGDDPGTKTRLYQSNDVTVARYDYTTLQERIFNVAMYQLQGPIDDIMNRRKKIHQLDLFQEPNTDVLIPIPLKLVGTPGQYTRIKEAAKNMCGIIVTMRGNDLHGKTWKEYAGLFSKVQVHDTYSNIITCHMRQDVARHLISVDISEAGRPKNYTGYLLEVALSTGHKYSSRIYKLISSWKDKGGMYITLDQLRDWLGLGDKYTDYHLLKKRILDPVQEELKEIADCWYNMGEIEEIKDGKKVVALRFKIVNSDIEKQRADLFHNLYTVIQQMFQVTKLQWVDLEPVLAKQDRDTVLRKIEYIDEYLYKNPTIRDRAKYATTALLNEFTEK